MHGLGMTGKNMAAFTGLAQRGPAAGLATVFPDGWEEVWDGGGRLPQRAGIDDPGFIRVLIEKLVADGVAENTPPFLVGISNGALFVEHLARHGLLDVSGLVLVAGTTTKASRDEVPRPRQRAAVLCFEGTGDATMPYGGGPIGGRGLIGAITARRAMQRGETGDSRVVVALESVASDWAAANGALSEPAIERAPWPGGDLPVTKLSWSAPVCRPIVCYRIEGGGHGWPGGPQQMPARLIGLISRDLDATGMLLDMVQREIDPAGHPTS